MSQSDEDWKGWFREEEARLGGGTPEASTGDQAAVPASYSSRTYSPSPWPDQPPAKSDGGGGWDLGGFAPRGWRRWLRPKRLLLVFGVFLLVVVLGGVSMYFYLNSKLTRVNALVNYQGRPAAGAGTNWLITGSDSRGGLSRTQEDQLTLGHDVGGGRTDTIMILHLPANGTKPVLLSIPRDSYVEIPGHGFNKINASFAIGGPKLLAQTVQNATGLYISHYMGLGLDGLVSAVNDVGGVRMCLPAAMHDPLAGLNLKKGCQNLSGKQALAFTRTRAFALGDLQREQDQRQLVKSLLSKLTSTGTMLNPFASIPAADGVASSLTVDSGTQLYQLLSVAYGLRNPVSTTVPFGQFENTGVGSVIVWNHQQAQQLFGDLSSDRTLPKNLITGSKVQGTA